MRRKVLGHIHAIVLMRMRTTVTRDGQQEKLIGIDVGRTAEDMYV